MSEVDESFSATREHAVAGEVVQHERSAEHSEEQCEDRLAEQNREQDRDERREEREPVGSAPFLLDANGNEALHAVDGVRERETVLGFAQQEGSELSLWSELRLDLEFESQLARRFAQSANERPAEGLVVREHVDRPVEGIAIEVRREREDSSVCVLRIELCRGALEDHLSERPNGVGTRFRVEVDLQ